MGCFLTMYGKRGPDFIRGVLAGMAGFAVWRNGRQEIGSPEKPLCKAMEEVVNDLAENPEDFEDEIAFYTR